MFISVVIVFVAAAFLIISNVMGTSNQRGNRSNGRYRRSGHSSVDPNLHSPIINNHSDDNIHRHHHHGQHHDHHHHHDHGSSSSSNDSSSGSDSGGGGSSSD
ncbi:hypothetical protein [Paenibacillus glycanilyticus]|uniref:hypothetical protein n=1 Tax=Paenibacillus glycanilyticus TaxID=126569 RepID=UPI00295ED505|nr:hypothetical protein [Paenibacillus glycanilyticus]